MSRGKKSHSILNKSRGSNPLKEMTALDTIQMPEAMFQGRGSNTQTDARIGLNSIKLFLNDQDQCVVSFLNQENASEFEMVLQLADLNRLKNPRARSAVSIQTGSPEFSQVFEMTDYPSGPGVSYPYLVMCGVKYDFRNDRDKREVINITLHKEDYIQFKTAVNNYCKVYEKLDRLKGQS